MRITPQIDVDFDDFPEAKDVYSVAIPNVATLMQLHGILELRRIRKTGAFGRPFSRDIVIPANQPGLPSSAYVSQPAVAKSLLDYLESVGIRGINLEPNEAELASVKAAWGIKEPQKKEESTDNNNKKDE